MALVPVVEDGRSHYKGSGFLTFGDGGFDFKLLADQGYDPGSIFQSAVAKPGQFLGDSDYYTLHATDINHRVWQSSEVFPKLQKAAGIVASGRVDWIRSVTPHQLSVKKNVVQLWFPEKLPLPYDQAVHSVSRVGEKIVGGASRAGATSFSSSGYDLSFGTSEGWTTIEASKVGELPGKLPACLQESLAFVLGRSIQATIIQEFDSNQITTTILPARANAYTSHSYPPLAYLSPADAVWRLYESFFRYSVEREGQVLSLSTILQYIFRLFGAPLDALALALGVAVEGLLKTEYSATAKPPSSTLAELKRAEEILKESDLSSSIVSRIVGSIGNMKSPSAKDRLFALAQSGVILPSQVAAWSKLRNSTAHAANHEFDDAFLSLCHKVLVLLYCLVFNLLGYAGPFTDYGTLEWPEREYPFATESESPHNSTKAADA
ncbi:MAG TPA: hypothetical protein VJ725_34785 [Thermoanaerobaculia bacterium]|nr:hypothetical protein [Thermoanaerobaculia bacterium]